MKKFFFFKNPKEHNLNYDFNDFNKFHYFLEKYRHNHPSFDITKIMIKLYPNNYMILKKNETYIKNNTIDIG